MKKKIFTRIFAGLFCVSLVVTSLDSVVYADSAGEQIQAEQVQEQTDGAGGQSESEGQNAVDLQNTAADQQNTTGELQGSETGQGTETNAGQNDVTGVGQSTQTGSGQDATAGTNQNAAGDGQTGASTSVAENTTEKATEAGKTEETKKSDTEKDTESDTEKDDTEEDTESDTEEDKKETKDDAINYEALKTKIDALPTAEALKNNEADATKSNEDFGAIVDELYNYKLIDENASEFALTEAATSALGTDRVAKLKALSDYFTGGVQEADTTSQDWSASITEVSWQYKASKREGVSSNVSDPYIRITLSYDEPLDGSDDTTNGGAYAVVGPDGNLVSGCEAETTGAKTTTKAFPTSNWFHLVNRDGGTQTVTILVPCTKSGVYKVIRSKAILENGEYTGNVLNSSEVGVAYAYLLHLSDQMVIDNENDNSTWETLTWQCFSLDPAIYPNDAPPVNDCVCNYLAYVSDKPSAWSQTWYAKLSGSTSSFRDPNTNTSYIAFDDGTKARISVIEGRSDLCYCICEVTYSGSANQYDVTATLHPTTESERIWVDDDGNVKDNISWETNPGSVEGSESYHYFLSGAADDYTGNNAELLKCVSSLTGYEIIAHAKGEDCKFSLEVSEIEALQANHSEQAVDDWLEQMREQDTRAFYEGYKLTISLKKNIPLSAESKEVSNFNATTINYRLPTAMIPDNTVERTFYVIKFDDNTGSQNLLSATYDATTKKLSFQADQSTDYVIVYADKAKTKISSVTSVTAPKYPTNSFTNIYTTNTVLESCNTELGTTAEITLDDATKVMVPVTWSVTEYNDTPVCSNEFTWTIDADSLKAYDVKEGVATTGKVTIGNVDYGKTTSSIPRISRVNVPKVPDTFQETYTAANVLDSKELEKTTAMECQDGKKVYVSVQWSLESGQSYDETAGATNEFRWKIADDISFYEFPLGSSYTVTTGVVTIKNKADDSSSGGNSGSTGGTTGGSGSTGGSSGTSGGNTGDTTGGVTGNIDTTIGDGTGGTTGGTTGGNSGNTGSKPNGKKHGTTDGKNDKNKGDKNKDDKNNGKNDKNGSDGSTTGENGNGNNGGNAGTIDGNGGNTSGSGNGNSGSTSGGSGNGSGNGNGSGTIIDTKDIPTETKTQIASAVEKVQKLDSNIKTGGYVKSESEDISFAIPEDILKDGRSYYLVTADEDGNAKILQNESTEDGMFSATGEADTTYQIIYEEGVPLASMISEDGTLMDDTDAANCYWHWGILAVTLAGIALALFLGKKSKKYFMIVALVTTAINAAFMVGGNCILDKIFLLCEIALMLLAYAFFLRKNEKTQEA